MSGINEQAIFKRYKTIPLASLVMAPWNYKTDDDHLQSKLVANIKKNGQVENLLVRSLKDGKFEVVNGNHRFKALRELGYKKVLVCDLSPMSEEEAKRIALETNETRFESDPLMLAQLVNSVGDSFADFTETAPFTDEQFENFEHMIEIEHPEEQEDQAPKGNRTKTVLSVGGEAFKIVKLELSTECADRFIQQLERLRQVAGEESSHDLPIEVICSILEDMDDEKLQLDKRLAPKKSAKKMKKKK